MTTTVFDPLKYGNDLHYYAKIGGIPTIFAQRVSGKTLPSDFTTEDASLVVGGSAPIGAQVDRNRGVGFGFPLTFRLIDTPHVRTWIKRWTKAFKITSTITAAATTIAVSDVSGWVANEYFWLGAECIKIGAIGVGQFVGCTRGVAGLAYAHDAAGVTAYGTDLPRWWRGRSVELFAVPITPNGAFPDNAWLETHAEMIWAGHVSRGPRLESAGLWAFEALAIDRRMDRPLSTAMTGEVVGAQVRRQLDKGAVWVMRVRGSSPGAGGWAFDHTMALNPYDASVASTFYTSTEARKLILDAFGAYLAAHAGPAADIDSAAWFQTDAGTSGGGKHTPPRYHLLIKMKANAAVVAVVVGISTQKVFALPNYHTQTPAGLAADQFAGTNLYDNGDPALPSTQLVSYNNTFRSIELDTGAPADVPASGHVWIDDQLFKYAGRQAGAGGIVFIAGVRTVDDGAVAKGNHVGETARFVVDDNGNAATVVRNALESSGEAALRGTFDTKSVGYGIDSDAVDEVGIATVLGSGWVAGLQLSVAFGGRSLIDLFGGLLALTGKALVARQIPGATNRRVQITAVDTLATASAWTVTISDADLVVDGSTPSVATIPVADAVNVIEVKGIDTKLAIELRDASAVQAQGEKRTTFEVPLKDRNVLLPVVVSWAKSRFASEQVLQAVKLRVVPWKQVDVGDAFQVDVTHHALWTFSSSAPGYTGIARCIARRFDPTSKVVELVALIDGLSLSHALCPAAPVVGFDVAAAPTYIDVSSDYFPHFLKTSTEAGGNFNLIFVEPGTAESIAEGYVISAVAESGGNCRLTVDSVNGAPTLIVADTFVALPDTASASAYQSDYAHDDDGSSYA